MGVGVFTQCCFCYTLVYAIAANDVCPHLLVPPSALIVLPSSVLLAYKTACTRGINRLAYFRERERERERGTFCNSFIQKKGG